MAEEDNLRQFEIVNGKLMPYKVSPAMAPRIPADLRRLHRLHAGGFMSISADGDRAGTGVLWAATTLSGNANADNVTGLLIAVTRATSARCCGPASRWPRETASAIREFRPTNRGFAGRVYLPTFSNQYCVYGRL